MGRGIVFFAVFLAACGSAYAPKFAPVDSDGKVLRTPDGHQLVLRGVNARVDGVFDVNFTDGRAPREIIPTFDSDDVDAMRASGFNLVRLPVNWSAIEPDRGAFDSGYLDKVAAVIDTLRGSGIYVLVDFHEDGWSKEICEDGAPLWAIDPPPAMLVGGPGPLASGPDCHTASAAIKAFNNFFDGTDGLQDDYVAMATFVAQRFAGDQQVLGYEIMNEPIGDDDLIAAFSAKVAAAIRAVDPQHLIVFEPSATRNFTNSAPLPNKPFPVEGGVYAVHIYNPGPSNPAYPTVIAGSAAAARDEADAWGTPLIVDEFGQAASADGAQWIGTLLDAVQGASTALWLWKEQSQGEWGLYTHQSDGSWAPRPIMFDAVARPYAQSVGGDLDAMTWDGTTLTVSFHGHAGVPATHDIFWNRDPPSVTCDGQSVAAAATAGSLLYHVECGGAGAHVLALR
jgi:endoglycosylceramidase